MEKEFTAVSIPTSLYKKIEARIKGTEYTSVASYVAKIICEFLARDEQAVTEAFSKEEEEKIKEKLKALGYID